MLLYYSHSLNWVGAKGGWGGGFFFLDIKGNFEMSDKKADFSGEFDSGTKNVRDAVKKRDFVGIDILTRSSGKIKKYINLVG